MDRAFQRDLARSYKSASQRIRIMSEAWVQDQMFCPSCGRARLERHANNRPAGDFHCLSCLEHFELKSKAGRFGPKIVDGAYAAMLDKVRTQNTPNFFLLGYDPVGLSVTSLEIVPKQFLSEQCLQQRRALSPSARRAGWVGCNILLSEIPRAGIVSVITKGGIQDRTSVLHDWSRVIFIRNNSAPESRGWLLETMKCIDHIGKETFGLDEVYALAPRMSARFPNNKHVKPKLRQQLQILRDAGFLTFLGGGRYRLSATSA